MIREIIDYIFHIFDKDSFIAYKVVDRTTRRGTNWALFQNQKHIYGPLVQSICDWIDQHPEYFPVYKRGKVLEEAPDSVGLMCFADKEYAQAFINEYKYMETFIIIRVRVLNSDRKPDSLIKYGCGTNPTRINEYSGRCDAVDGTIFCKKLKVLS